MKTEVRIRKTYNIAGVVILLILLSTMITLFFYTSRQQTIIADNQRTISHFYLSWVILKDELYSSTLEEKDYYPLIVSLSTFKSSFKEVFATESFNSRGSFDKDVNDSFRAIYVKWPYLDAGLQQLVSAISVERDPSQLQFFLTSPLVLSFENDLIELDHEIYRISRNRLRKFQLMNNVLIVFLLLLFFALVLYFYYNHQNSQASERIRALTQSLLKVHEEEKKQIAYTLHDDIIQDMASLKISVDNLIDVDPDTSNREIKHLRQISRAMQDIIQSTRRISGTIRPYNLDHLGLVGAIRMMCNDMARQTRVHVQFRPVGMEKIRLDYTTQINLYRITQEGLRNIRKHSSASHAIVRLIASSPHIILRIKDNGRGFNPTQIRTSDEHQGNHIGLTSIEERTKLLRGRVQISSGPGKGTEIKVQVPIQYAPSILHEG